MREKVDSVAGVVAKLYVAAVMENKEMAKENFEYAMTLLFNLRQELRQFENKAINYECKCSEPDPEDGSVSTRRNSLVIGVCLKKLRNIPLRPGLSLTAVTRLCVLV